MLVAQANSSELPYQTASSKFDCDQGPAVSLPKAAAVASPIGSQCLSVLMKEWVCSLPVEAVLAHICQARVNK